MHFSAIAMSSTNVLQAASCIYSYQLPSVQRSIVGTHGISDVIGFVVVANDPILVYELRAFAKPGGAPVSPKLWILAATSGELPVAEQIVEITLVRLV